MNAPTAPALLRYPVWYGGTETMPLPMPPQHYCVQQFDGHTIVSVIASGDIVYDDVGPADVVPPGH